MLIYSWIVDFKYKSFCKILIEVYLLSYKQSNINYISYYIYFFIYFINLKNQSLKNYPTNISKLFKPMKNWSKKESKNRNLI